MRKLIAQFTRFGIVGFVGLLIDFAIFNVLRLTVFSPENIHEGPVYAKLISTAVAIVFNWIGNRYWTFREHRGRQLWREFVEFLVVSLGGMAIGLGCLWVSHYLLGFTSLLADNIATNGVGLALGTLFRFTLYRAWVFAPHRGDRAPALFPDAGPQAVSVRREPSSRPSAGTAPAGAATPPG